MTAVPVATPPPQVATYTYRLLQGQHEEKSPEGQNRLYRRGDTFESTHPRLADVWPEKFSRVHAAVHNPNLEAWDPARETIEQFSERMKTKHGGGEAQQVAAPNPLATPPNGGGQPVAPPQRQAPAKLDQMSLKDLQALAADDEIDLKGAKTRDEVLKILKGMYT